MVAEPVVMKSTVAPVSIPFHVPAVTSRLPLPMSVAFARKLTVSFDLASMIKSASKAASTPSMLIVSAAASEVVTMVSDGVSPVGLGKVTLSARLESIVIIPAAASLNSRIVSAPPVNVKTRSSMSLLSVIGSRPMNVSSATRLPSEY